MGEGGGNKGEGSYVYAQRARVCCVVDSEICS